MVTIVENLDADDGITTAYSIAIKDEFVGQFTAADVDWTMVNLEKDKFYRFSATGDGAIPADDLHLRIRDKDGFSIDFDDDSGPGRDAELVYQAKVDGVHFLAVDARTEGSYKVSTAYAAAQFEGFTDATDAAANSSTDYSMDIGTLFRGDFSTRGFKNTDQDGNLIFQDVDWIRVTLEQDKFYEFFADPTSANAGFYPILTVYDSSGKELDTIDQGNSINDHYGHQSIIAKYSGTYYLGVKSSSDSSTGNYLLEAKEVDAPALPFKLPVYNLEQIRDQMIDGFWHWSGEAGRSFDVSGDSTLTYHIAGLTDAGKKLARVAFDTWAAVSGLTFQETVDAAGSDIVIDDEEEGASTGFRIIAGFVDQADINIDDQWITDDGEGLESYAYSTYIHEIGHALGLGHTGNYNGNADFEEDGSGDNHYLNDIWQLSVMSYIDQVDNTHITANYANVVTPMIADIMAIQKIYGGLAVDHNSGDTRYDLAGAGTVVTSSGMDWNGDALTLTLFDTGGVDTFDASATDKDQKVNLNDGRIWDVGGDVGTIVTARGTLIDNFRGGTGKDKVTGNELDNKIRGDAGDDVIRGGNGNDLLVGNGDDDKLFGQVGEDTLSGGAGEDRMEGGQDKDILVGGSNTDTLIGGRAKDIMRGGGGDDTLRGEDGRDRIAGGKGNDTHVGGDGADRFQFRGNRDEGVDTIKDFEDGVDLIQITRGITFADLAIAGITGGTSVSWGSGTFITLENIAAANLTSDDFLTA